jgi:hypothetical protein
MKLLAISLFALSVWAQDSTPNTLTPAEAKAGWILLFDGKTMNHWVDPRTKTPPGDAWTIEDGCLKARKHPRITEDLFSGGTYRDFELQWDWKISPGGNSGLKYRIQDHLWVPRQPGMKFEAQVEHAYENRTTARPDHGQDYVVGFEYQMTDDTSNSDAVSHFKHTAGALYDMVPPSSHPLRPVGEFNHSRIVVRGNHVEHWLNGVKVVDSSLDAPAALEGMATRWKVAPEVYNLLSKQPKKDCPISLQNHDNDAWFRSIKIRKL